MSTEKPVHTSKVQEEPSILEVSDLSLGFPAGKGWKSIVDRVSFHIPRGQCLGIVGESGSGKSLTALSLLGLVPKPGQVTGGETYFASPTKGRISLHTLTSKEWRGIRGNELAMIFQEPMSALNPVLTCGKQIEESLKIHTLLSSQEIQKKIEELFDRVELPPKTIKAYPHEISGGQKQRVMIAMAMSCDPVLLIADEPTTALDVTIQARILSLLRELQKERQLSLLFITHDLGVVAEIADQVLVMKHGKAIENLDTESLFLNPEHPYTKGLLACRPRLDSSVRRLPTVEEYPPSVGSMSAELDPYSKVPHEIRKESPPRIPTEISEPFLRVEGLQTWFPLPSSGKEKRWVKAVEDVSFSLYPGETLGLVGESGCGKTTLGRTLLHLIPPTAGKVWIEGTDFFGLTPKERRRLRQKFQVIFQDPYSSLNPRKRIGTAIQEAMRVHGVLANDTERKHHIHTLLERVGLEASHYRRYPHEFSGGQRQRVCIARALALEPLCLICDESVSALDVSVQAQVLNLLKDLQEERKLAYLFISHDMAIVKHMSDRVMVMRSGKIWESQSAESIYRNPQIDYTKGLLAAIPTATPQRIRELRTWKFGE